MNKILLNTLIGCVFVFAVPYLVSAQGILFNGTANDVAISPAILKGNWSLTAMEVIEDMDNPPDTTGPILAMEIDRLKSTGVTSMSTFDYCNTLHEGPEIHHYVTAIVCIDVEACRKAWLQELGEYSVEPMSDLPHLGDQGLQMIGRHTSSIFFRRANVHIAINSVTEGASISDLAEQIDRKIQSLLIHGN